jgi:hypothetical protein
MEYIIGVIVGLFVQYLKRKLGTDVAGTYLVVLLLSFVAAGTYVLIKDTTLWPAILQIMTVAGAFYAYIIRRFETS